MKRFKVSRATGKDGKGRVALGFVEAATESLAAVEAMTTFRSYGLNASNIILEYCPVAEF